MYSALTNKKNKKSSFSKKLISFAFNTGLIRYAQRIWSKSLTVLNYHRIDDPHKNNLDSFQPNISAHPDEFKRQMEYLAQWFHVISVRDVSEWIEGNRNLPPYAALITFDDGYLDNYTNAYPVLRENKFPAVVYLTTGHIDTDKPFYWDLAAYCFTHTSTDHVELPDRTELSWRTHDELLQTLNLWVESLKLLPDIKKQEWAQKLPEKLGVSIPVNTFRNLMMNWEQIREMHKNGIDFGGHTINHPILTRIPLDVAQAEIKESKNRIENELGEPIDSFAYPNGMKSDFNTRIEKITCAAGYKTAFTLLNGPASLSEVRRNPYTIRRSFISHNHTLQQFSTLISPFNRLR